MRTINTQVLEQFIIQHQSLQYFDKYLQENHFQNPSKPWEIDSSEILKLSVTVNKSEPFLNFKEDEIGKNTSSKWKKRQLKLYNWVLLYYCFIFRKSIDSLVQHDFEFLQSIFQSKSSMVLKYQTLRLIPISCSKTMRLEWSQEEDNILQNMIEEFKKDKKQFEWRLISLSIFLSSQGKVFRHPSQCRQRWNNHKNPQLSKANWTLNEDELLINLVKQKGHKWSGIAKFFKGKRNEHMIKNRYKSLASRIKRTQPKISEKQINRILLKEVYEKKTKQQFVEKQQNSLQNIRLESTSKEDIKQKNSKLKTSQVDIDLQNNTKFALRSREILQVQEEQLPYILKNSYDNLSLLQGQFNLLSSRNDSFKMEPEVQSLSLMMQLNIQDVATSNCLIWFSKIKFLRNSGMILCELSFLL